MGCQSHCRECVKAYQKRYRQTEREHYLELRRQERERRKPEILAYMAEYHAANREEILRRARARQAALPLEKLEEQRARHRIRSAAYRQLNPELCNERIRAWKAAHPDKASDGVNRRRAWWSPSTWLETSRSYPASNP